MVAADGRRLIIPVGPLMLCPWPSPDLTLLEPEMFEEEELFAPVKAAAAAAAAAALIEEN